MNATIEMKAETTSVRTPDEPTASPIERYRRAVIAGEFSVEVCDGANRIKSEFDRDSRILTSRVAARSTLDVEVPKLEAEALAAEEAAGDDFVLQVKAGRAREIVYATRQNGACKKSCVS